VPKRLFDGLALFGRARFDATTLPGAVRCPARRQASKRLDMSDPTGLRDEAVMLLNELLYLNVGRHSCHPRGPSSVTGAYGATAATLLRGESRSARRVA